MEQSNKQSKINFFNETGFFHQFTSPKINQELTVDKEKYRNDRIN